MRESDTKRVYCTLSGDRSWRATTVGGDQWGSLKMVAWEVSASDSVCVSVGNAPCSRSINYAYDNRSIDPVKDRYTIPKKLHRYALFINQGKKSHQHHH